MDRAFGALALADAVTAAVLTTSSTLSRETNWAAMRRAGSRLETMPAQNAESWASLSDGEDKERA
jgi:hypothetical protein